MSAASQTSIDDSMLGKGKSKRPCIPQPSITADTKKSIEELINYSYKRDVRDTIYGRFSWRKWSDFYEASSKVFSGVATIAAFAAGAYNDPHLSFAAGTIGTVSLVFMTLAAYATKESKERTEQLNATLVHLGVARVPDISGSGGNGTQDMPV